MGQEQLAQVGRLLQDGNLMSASDAARTAGEQLDGEDDLFLHPDEARSRQQQREADLRSGRGSLRRSVPAQVLVATDAALKLAPEVRRRPHLAVSTWAKRLKGFDAFASNCRGIAIILAMTHMMRLIARYLDACGACPHRTRAPGRCLI